MIKNTSAPFIIPIPATATGLICPVGDCSHKHPGGFPFLSFSHQFGLSSLTFYEWFVTEKSFSWWQQSLNTNFTNWTNWAMADCCLESRNEACFQVNDLIALRCSFVHHASFVDESRFDFSSKISCLSTSDSKQVVDPFEVRIECSFQDKSLTEATATMDFYFAGPSPPSQTLKREVIHALQNLGGDWVKFAEERIDRITKGEEVDKPSQVSRGVVTNKPPGVDVRGGSQLGGVMNSSSFKSFWPIVLLIGLLAMIVPTISLLFFRIHSMSGNLERHQTMAKEIGEQIEEIRSLLVQRT